MCIIQVWYIVAIGPGWGGSLVALQMLLPGLLVSCFCVAACSFVCWTQDLPIRVLNIQALKRCLGIAPASRATKETEAALQDMLQPLHLGNLRMRLFLALSAVPFGCLTMMLVCTGCVFLLRSVQPPWVMRELYLIVWLSVWLVCAMLTLRVGPAKIRFWSRLRLLYHDDPNADRIAAQTMLSQTALADVRPRAQNPELIEMAVGLEDGS